MKMRKVLSLVLALALVLGSFSMAFASTFSDTAGTASAEAVNVLSELGVVNGYEDGTYKPAQVVTRAEAAKLIVAALGLTDYATGSTSNFTDMANYGWAQGFVGYAQALGILKGYGDGTYHPGATVTYNEMATIVVRALGYTDASLAGTWPANYVAKAKTLGIMDSITGGGGATGANRGDCAIMIYNALDLAIGSVDAENKWTFEIKPGTTNAAADTMYYRLGVKATADASIITYSDAESAAANITSKIGAYATTLKDKNGDIITLDDVKSTFLTGKMSGSKFKAAGVEYTIEPTGTIGVGYGASSSSVTTGAIVFDNGDVSDVYTTIGAVKAKAVTTVTLAVKLSGTTIKDVYSVLEWNIEDHDFFTSNDATDIEEDNELFGYDFPKDDNSVIDTSLFALNGASSLDNIEVDDVVYVYARSNGEIIRVDVGTEKVSGEITRIKGNDYTIGGTVYTKADQMASNTITPSAGDEVTAILDYSGKVYKFEKLSGGPSDYAVIVDIDHGTTGLSGTEPKVKLLAADGTVTVLTADEESVANTILDETTKQWQYSNYVTYGAIIKYSVDSDGLVDEISTTNALSVENDNVTATGYYNGLKIASDAVIFTVDDDLTTTLTKKSDDWGVTTRDKILDSKDVQAKYVTKDGVIVAMLINSEATGDEDIYGVITGGAQNNSAAKYEITVLIDGVEATYNTKTEFTSNDTTKSYLYDFSYDTAGNIKYANATALTGVITTTTGAVTDIAGNVVTIDKPYTLDDNVVVYTWSTADSKYKKGRIRDINDTTYTNVALYDTNSTPDKVYDIVLVK